MWWGTAIEAPDPGTLAAFYSRLLDWPVVHREPGTAIIKPPQDSVYMVFLIIALAAWWQAVPQLARMLTGADGADPTHSASSEACANSEEHARRRASVVRAAQRLALPLGSIS